MSQPTSDDANSAAVPSVSASASPLEGLRQAVLAAAEDLALAPGGAPGAGSAEGDGRREDAKAHAPSRAAITLERPKRAAFGDYSTNAALLLAPTLGAPPREIAERLGSALQARLASSLERFEVAGPGFVNLFRADSWLTGALAEMLEAGEGYGGGQAPAPERVLVEFVSANPTGPMHVGHARNAAYGDALARMLDLYGHDVQREFYVNDAGSQVRKFGEAVQTLARGEQLPEDGYKGDYVAELAARLPDAATMDAAALGQAAVKLMVEGIEVSLAGFRVEGFDRWFFESALHQGDPSPVAHSLAILAEQGHTYEHDIAYHQDKRERGFQRQIDVWGADHHGYVLRMKAAYEALGGDPGELDLLIMQLVHLMRSGERAQMSKRAGQFVSLEELVSEIGVDAARWYLLARSHDTTVDLDLDLAREQSNENSVYYVQYAHARIASMLARAGGERVGAAIAAVLEEELDPLEPAERALIERLLDFPAELAEAVDRRAPHRIAAYALDLAQGFTAFYRDCRVLGAEPERVESLRIALCVASARTIARCLGLLGVSAPEHM